LAGSVKEEADFGQLPDSTPAGSLQCRLIRLCACFKTAVGFPGEETAAPALGLALSAPVGQKSVPACPPRGF